eukprot:445685-Alexandrium_andersonii.AAC.1
MDAWSASADAGRGPGQGFGGLGSKPTGPLHRLTAGLWRAPQPLPRLQAAVRRAGDCTAKGP